MRSDNSPNFPRTWSEKWNTASGKRADNAVPGYLKSTLCTTDIDWALKNLHREPKILMSLFPPNRDSQSPWDRRASARLIMISSVAFLLIISYRKAQARHWRVISKGFEKVVWKGNALLMQAKLLEGVQSESMNIFSALASTTSEWIITHISYGVLVWEYKSRCNRVPFWDKNPHAFLMLCFVPKPTPTLTLL